MFNDAEDAGNPERDEWNARLGGSGAEPEASDEPLPIEWFGEIEPNLECRDFVAGTLTEGGASVVYGESNAGKTFLVTDLALCVATGRDWMGCPIEGGPVAYCVLEGGHGFRNRVHVWKQARGIHNPSVPFMSIPASINLLDPKADTPRLIATIQAVAEELGRPFKLIVIDTLSRALAGGNENAPEDMGALVRNMDLIRQQTGAALLFIHHSGKDAAKGARGHSLLRAAIDTEIEVTAEEDTGLRRAKIVKQRDMEKGQTYPFVLNKVVLGQDRRGNDVTSCTVEPPDEHAPKAPRAVSLTARQQGWLGHLRDLFALEGMAVERSPKPGMTPVRTITRDQFRDALRVNGCFDADHTGGLSTADRGRLRDTLEALRSKGVIGMTDRHLWLL